LEAAMSGHICRCTGYQGIRRAIRRLADAPIGEPA
jgi:carbon-monoxide dehydrogenase small subunit